MRCQHDSLMSVKKRTNSGLCSVSMSVLCVAKESRHTKESRVETGTAFARSFSPVARLARSRNFHPSHLRVRDTAYEFLPSAPTSSFLLTSCLEKYGSVDRFGFRRTPNLNLPQVSIQALTVSKSPNEVYDRDPQRSWPNTPYWILADLMRQNLI